MLDDMPDLISQWSNRLAQGTPHEVAQTLNGLIDRLGMLRDRATPSEWEEAILMLRNSELLPLLLEDPFTRWSYHRPRGFPGDAGLIDLIYAKGNFAPLLQKATPLGQRLFAALQARSSAQAVRNRRQMASEFLREVMGNKPGAEVLVLAAGHLREVDTELAEAGGYDGRIVALDQDLEALAVIAARLPEVELLAQSVRHLLMGRLDGRQFDASYSLGLYDYLTDPVAERLLAKQVELVRPGGRVMVCNFVYEALDRGYMEAFMDWKLIYRDERDMENLAARAVSGCTTRIYREPSRQVVFLELIKEA